MFGVKPFPEPMLTYCTYSMEVYDISHLLPMCDIWWLVAFWMPCHFMNLCRHIVQLTFWTNSMNVYGMSHLFAYLWHCQGCIEVYCLFKLVNIDTCDGLSPDQWQAITWTTADLLFIETFLTNSGFTLLKPSLLWFHGWPSTQPGSLHTALQRKYTQPCSLFSRSTAVWTMGARLCEQWGTAVCKCPAV